MVSGRELSLTFRDIKAFWGATYNQSNGGRPQLSPGVERNGNLRIESKLRVSPGKGRRSGSGPGALPGAPRGTLLDSTLKIFRALKAVET
jgi:hypothetical protein